MKKIEDLRILVVGDIMLDKYKIGIVERISPEAPIPIINITKEYETLGGCGNVINHVASLGAKTECITAVGFDAPGSCIFGMLKDLNVEFFNVNANLYADPFFTSTKTRFVTESGQQLLRSDMEKIIKVDYSTFEYDTNKKFDMIIVSDYNKGVVDLGLMMVLKKLNCPIIVDPKPRPGCQYIYSGVFMITPNSKEYKIMEEIPETEYVLVTLGSKGMVLHRKRDSKITPIKTEEPIEVYNVSGAGDTVVSIVGICISLGLDIIDACTIANNCARYVVTRPGTTVVPKKLFLELLEQTTNRERAF